MGGTGKCSSALAMAPSSAVNSPSLYPRTVEEPPNWNCSVEGSGCVADHCKLRRNCAYTSGVNGWMRYRSPLNLEKSRSPPKSAKPCVKRFRVYHVPPFSPKDCKSKPRPRLRTSNSEILMPLNVVTECLV